MQALHLTAPVRRRRRRRRRLVATTTVFAATLGVLLFAIEPASSSSWATVNGRRVPLHGREPTIGSVLRTAHRPVHDGSLLSAATRRVLDAHAFAGFVLVRGRPVGLEARVHPGEVVTVVDGSDQVETTERRSGIAIPAPPLPDVERGLWHPGRPGVGAAEVGVVSGEIARVDEVVTPPVAPAPERGKVVALTFDDGPSPVWTPQILSVLAEKQVHATFCVVGYAIRWGPQLVQAEAAQGHTICNHTAHHMEHLDAKPHADVVGEIGGGANAVTAVMGGAQPEFYRPPGGSLSPDVIAVAHANGERVITWTIDPDDFRRPPARVLLQRIMAAVRPGAIILLHDGGGDRSQTLAVLGTLIDALRAQGYSFTTPYTA